MRDNFITYKKSGIHYRAWGSGTKLLLCLHGFGETAHSFNVFEPLLCEAYTVIAVDMPLHGETLWNDDLLFTVNDIATVIDNIPEMHKRNFSLMGYSMGGRIALQLYQYLPGRIEDLILIAPDGIKINIWYRFATQNRLGNLIFKHIMKNPAIFFKVTTALKKLGMINIGVYNYVHIHLQDADMRMRLYNIWTTMRRIKPDIPIVKSLIATNSTRVILIYGRFDRVIQFTTGEKFKKGIENFCSLHILNSGHRMLAEKNAAAIATLL
ncbi:MAG: alpha/beta hydrolase [Bacteroidetes bacterium]|nr:alpha/beta hydrolase [Bacteroidota bacterium]